MIGAVVVDNIVQNTIVINPKNIEEMEKALNAKIVDAKEYGLVTGDLLTPNGWTRNNNGEQMILPKLEVQDQTTYIVMSAKLNNAEADKNMAVNMAIDETIGIVTGDIEITEEDLVEEEVVENA